MLSSRLFSHFFKHLPCTATALSGLQTPTLNNQGFSTRTASFSGTSFASLPYFSVQIQCPKYVSDSLSEALLCFGASSTTIDNHDNCQDIDNISITSIFHDCEDLDDCVSRAAKSIGLEETPSYKVTEGDQSEWIKLSQESFHPVEITDGLWTVPEWTTPPDPQVTNIILNSGFAFGTGEHPTTKLCLLLLHGLIKGGELVLDYGTGSGVLAIAAIKFGAAFSVGLDIDSEAITSARHNALLNNIEDEKLQLHVVDTKKKSSPADETGCESVEDQTKDIPDIGKYDVVIANILLNPLLDLADHIVSFAKPGAVVGVSGILSEQIPLIEGRYSPFLENITVSKIDDWACISGTKKSNMKD